VIEHSRDLGGIACSLVGLEQAVRTSGIGAEGDVVERAGVLVFQAIVLEREPCALGGERLID
jgi:hypothetical protein